MKFWGELPSKIEIEASGEFLLEFIDCLAHPGVFLEYSAMKKVITRIKYP